MLYSSVQVLLLLRWLVGAPPLSLDFPNKGGAPVANIVVMTSIPLKKISERFKTRQREALWPNHPEIWCEDHGLFLWSMQKLVAESVVKHKKTLVVTSNGVGKDFRLTEKLPTPTGWTTIGDVEVGDYVLDEYGQPTRVTAKSQVWNHELVKVIFNDGAEFVCSPNHEWVTLDFNEARRARKHIDGDWRNGWSYGRTRETREIMASLRHGKQNQANHYVPINAPIVGQEADLLIDPYVLGVWLGDGNSAEPVVTLGPRKKHVLDEFAVRGVTLKEYKHAPEKAPQYGFSQDGYRAKLRELGVLNNKHIPRVYLHASIAQRLDLLRGLMDTDGFNGGTKTSTCVGIDLMNEQLALGVVELVRSLGVRCSVSKERTYLNGEDVGPRWRMVFNPTFDPFTPGSLKSTERPKQDAQSSRKTVRTIVDVVPVPTEPTQCIEVDSKSHMYLVGEHMVPTHNSRLSATLCGWWVDTHPLHDTTVVTTATNWKQVRNVLWKEIPRVKQTAGIDGNITSDAQWKRGDRKDPVAFGMKPDDKDESGFQGIHDRYVLVIIDEAGGVSKEIFTAADAVTTNEHARILAIANPNDPSSYMATVFDKESKLPPEERSWNIIQFGSFDTPNFTGEKVPEEVASRLVRKEWVEARKREWGEDDPRYVARVLGQFPDVSDDGLFNLGRVLQSMNSYEDFDYDPNAPIRLGVDVARYGSDSSVITSYQDGKVSILKKLQNKNGPELAKIVGELATELKATEIRIDAVGVGVSVLDHIDAHVPPETKIIAIKGNAASPDSTKWYNWRAAMYDKFSRKVSMGEIALPNDEELYREIKSIRYLYRGSALLIESKEDMRRRKVHSPDILDAVIYASQDIEEAENDQETLVTVDDILEDFDFMPMSIFPG